jgi:hypothetical protein
MTVQKELVILGPLKDQVLHQISKAEGCKMLHCRKVNVFPRVIPKRNDFIVYVCSEWE